MPQLTEHTALVLFENLTALSRIHSKGTLFVPEAAIARESGYLQDDVHTALTTAKDYGWANEPSPKCWRIADSIVTTIPTFKYCDVCRMEDGFENRAIADARLRDGRWANLCTIHFAFMECDLGLGRGQFLRLEY